MPERDFSRVDRVASTIRRVLAAPLAARAREQGAGLATITTVDVSPDLRHARIGLSVYGAAAEPRDFVKSLAAHELQRELAGQLRTRRTPVLSFHLDDALARGDRIQRLLDDSADPPPGR